MVNTASDRASFISLRTLADRLEVPTSTARAWVRDGLITNPRSLAKSRDAKGRRHCHVRDYDEVSLSKLRLAVWARKVEEMAAEDVTWLLQTLCKRLQHRADNPEAPPVAVAFVQVSESQSQAYVYHTAPDKADETLAHILTAIEGWTKPPERLLVVMWSELLAETKEALRLFRMEATGGTPAFGVGDSFMAGLTSSLAGERVERRG